MKRVDFRNLFLDRLGLDDYPVYLRSLRRELNISKIELAQTLGLKESTIERYEKTGAAPVWYELILRFMCGDLSAHGNHWQDCRIYRGVLTTPNLPSGMQPFELIAHYHKIGRSYRMESERLRQEIHELKRPAKPSNVIHLFKA